MIRRLIHWLARKEIQSAVERERAECVVGINYHINAAFLRGHTAGAESAFDCMTQVCRERTHGADDIIQQADVDKAKKGFIH